MRNVLIISSAFPPMGGVASQRVAKFVKYLPSFGWHSIILTLRKDKHTRLFLPMDYSLCSDLPKNAVSYETDHLFYWLLHPLLCVVEKELKGHKFWKHLRATRVLECIRWILKRLVIPGALIGWYPFAVIKSKYIMRKHNINLIYSNSPSPVAHLIACKLAERYSLPWVADFRDPWAYSYFDEFISPAAFLNMRLEKGVLEKADRFVVLEPKIIDEFKALKNDFDPDMCFLIENGYDEEDFKDISPRSFNKHFTIVYSGKLSQKRRSPKNLFVALSSLFQENPDLKNKIKVIFIGGDYPFLKGLIEEHNLEGCVEAEGYLEHKKALSYICGASVLYLLADETQEPRKPFQGKDVIPAKLYEYLRARRPILALVPEDSDCAQVIRDTHSGIVIEPADYQKIKEAILDMYERYKNGKLEVESDAGLIQQYERKALTKKLVKIFDELLLEKQGCRTNEEKKEKR